MFQKQNRTQRVSFHNESRANSKNQKGLLLSDEVLNQFSQSTNNAPNLTPDLQFNQRDQSLNERIAMSILNSPNSYGSNARSIMNRTFNQNANNQLQPTQINGTFVCAPPLSSSAQMVAFQFPQVVSDNQPRQDPQKSRGVLANRRKTVSTNLDPFLSNGFTLKNRK